MHIYKSLPYVRSPQSQILLLLFLLLLFLLCFFIICFYYSCSCWTLPWNIQTPKLANILSTASEHTTRVKNRFCEICPLLIPLAAIGSTLQVHPSNTTRLYTINRRVHWMAQASTRETRSWSPSIPPPKQSMGCQLTELALKPYARRLHISQPLQALVQHSFFLFEIHNYCPSESITHLPSGIRLNQYGTLVRMPSSTNIIASRILQWTMSATTKEQIAEKRQDMRFVQTQSFFARCLSIHFCYVQQYWSYLCQNWEQQWEIYYCHMWRATATFLLSQRECQRTVGCPGA